MCSSTEKIKIVIIGAGAAGLAAGSLLTKHGFDVTVLEARNRIGGRMHTDYSFGIPFDLGASWIHGTEGNPIVDLAHQCNARYMLTNFEKRLLFSKDKKIISPAEFNEFREYFDKIIEAASRLAHSTKTDMSLFEALNKAEANKTRFLNFDNLWAMSLHYLSGYTGADLRDLSAQNWDEEEILPGGNFLMIDGYLPIANELAKGCHIILNTTVKKIIRHSDHVEIITNQETIKSHAVIITASLGVLKNNTIHFEPSLPDFKLKAIENLGMGLIKLD